MTPTEYLRKILDGQTLDPNGQELADLTKRGEDVVATLNREFAESDKAIRYAGSHAKGSMIRESYDLDIACYFANEDTSAGETLEDIFNNVKAALEKDYRVRPKTSALRLRSNEKDSLDVDFHIDVVPGRYSGPERSDAFLHLRSREKCRMKTNLDVHVQAIRWSGCLDEIRLMKLWNVQTGLQLKTFVLELATIKNLQASDAPTGLPERLRFVWEYLRDNSDTFTVEDPANPTGNDLCEYLDDQVRARIKKVASTTIDTLDKKGWEAIFGPAEEPSKAQGRGGNHCVPDHRNARPAVAAMTPWFVRDPALLESVRQAADGRLQTLHLVIEGERVFLRGSMAVVDPGTGAMLARYDVELEFPDDYPAADPIVRETGGAIPKIADRHFNRDGSACLCLPEARFRQAPANCCIDEFVEKLVRPFFLWQTHLNLTGEIPPSGEWRHNIHGLLQFYSEEAGSEDFRVVMTFLRYLTAKKARNQWPCYCGSGNKLRDCHAAKVNTLRSTIDRKRAAVLLSSLEAAKRQVLAEHRAQLRQAPPRARS